jgi:CheY-like chemotaxis protein
MGAGLAFITAIPCFLQRRCIAWKQGYEDNPADATGIFRRKQIFFVQTFLPATLCGCFLYQVFMDQAKLNSNTGLAVSIFVVDDEPMLLDLAKAILQPLGYDVRTFRDPQTALAELPAVKPTVIVTDYAMGAMSGMDLIRECKRLNPLQKMVLLSGTVDENIYADSAAKPDIFLPKPYQVRDFVESVQKLAPR